MGKLTAMQAKKDCSSSPQALTSRFPPNCLLLILITPSPFFCFPMITSESEMSAHELGRQFILQAGAQIVSENTVYISLN